MRSPTDPRIAAVVLLAAALACAGPPTPSPMSGEPVCTDFEVGAAKTKMRGGLRLPVALTLLEGDKPVFRTTILGLRAAQEPPTRILLRDDNAEYKVEWAQCENERAPRPAVEAPAPKNKSTAAPTREPPAEYECGKAVVYKTDKLVTKKGDLSTHALAFPAPPKTECWTSEAPPAAPSGAADAGAPPTATGEPGAAASAEAGAAPAASASAPAASASAPAASASAPAAATPSGSAKAAK